MSALHPVRVGRLPWREVDGSAVIIHPRMGEVHGLSSVATAIWRLSDGSRDVSAIAAAISAEYDVETDVVSQDVTEFLNQLEDLGLLEWTSSGQEASPHNVAPHSVS